MIKILVYVAFIIIILKLTPLMFKRLYLLCAVKKKCKQLTIGFKTISPWWKSIFIGRGRPDFVIGEKVKVSVFTLPLKNVRYHFIPDEQKVEIILGLMQMFVINRNTPKGARNSTNIFKIFEYPIHLKADEEYKNIFLVYPVPNELSTISGNKIVGLYDGDEVCKNVIFNTKSYFLDHLEEYIK